MTELTAGKTYSPRRYLTVSALGFLAVLVATCLLADLLARNRSLERWMMAVSSDNAERNGRIFSNTGNFIDFEDRLLLDELPNADYSHGGIYFFGTSNMKWAFTTWDLQPELQRHIGIYSIGGSPQTTHLRLFRYLVDQRGLGTAGERDEVIFGVSFHLGTLETKDSYFFSLLRRHGLYAVAPDGRMVDTDMNPVERALRIEKARTGGFIWNAGRLLINWTISKFHLSRQPPHNPEVYRHNWREAMGADWQKNFDREVDRLRESIELAHAHKMQVKVLFVPQGYWMEELPFPAYFDARVRALCQATSTPIIDLEHALPDDAFVDSNHLTVDGQTKVRELLMPEITGHLKRAGLIK